MPLTLHPDRRLLRTIGGSTRFLVVRITAPASPAEHLRPGANLAFIVDRSGSMSGEKIDRARTAVIEAIRRLEPRDRFAVVAYDSRVELVVPTAFATEAHRTQAELDVLVLDDGGGTNLSEGWLAGGNAVLEALTRDQVGRCLLLTDGQANEGITSPDALAGEAAGLRARGVSTSTFGIGEDFDETLLTRIADAGGGTFRFIESHEKIVALINDELLEALDVVARDVVVRVDAPARVKVAVIGPYAVKREHGVGCVALPDLVSSQVLELVLQLEFPPGTDGQLVPVRVSARSRDDALTDARAEEVFTFAQPAENDRQPRDRDVELVAAQRFAGLARERAAVLNRDGNLTGAVSELEGLARRLRHRAGTDAQLLELAAALEADAAAAGRRMAELDRKRMHSGAVSMVRSKRPDGSSRRDSPR